MMDARQMAAAMRRMGIQTRDVADVEEVVVRTANEEYRFRRPAVSVIRAQGSETWQIVGKPTMSSTAAAEATPAPKEAPTAAPYTPSEQDIAVVAETAGVPAAVARKALVDTNGDLAEAIVRLQS